MKKLWIVISLVFLGLISWFLFIKPYDYRVSMKTKTIPGIFNQTLKTWSGSLNDSKVLQGQDMNSLKQTLVFNDSVFVFDYSVTPVHDSLSEVQIDISYEKSGPMFRIANLFGQTDFEKRSKNTVLNLNDILKEHLSSFRVRIEGEAELKSTYCAFVELESSQLQKAQGMMSNNSLLSSYLLENKVELNGLPFVEITKWDRENDQIKYNFCYPIVKSDSLPQDDLILFKQVDPKKAIKAIYNGNYISSDRAWYYLIEYATMNSIAVDPQPVEIFFNNPSMGGEELDWVAEVYMPLSENK